MNIELFLEQMRIQGEKTAAKMAAIELEHWDGDHESQLIEVFKFTPEQVLQRKRTLEATKKP